ncbi:hypothetical protein [Candidatus Methylobacter oryzae]|uniref:hypothetical protein n=1 Tax=Candidatus Methylobacter oryzae TaxID=2497749 RepID=UPI0018AD3803|nr:hypothetical protein [Candidatus Methylobacter oryzae]
MHQWARYHHEKIVSSRLGGLFIAALISITPPMGAVNSELAQMLASGRIEIVADAGHAAPVTHGRQVNRLSASFLNIEPPM